MGHWLGTLSDGKLFNGYGVSVWEEEKVLDLDGGDDTYCHLTVYFINKKWLIWKIFYVYFTTHEKILHFTGKEIQIKTMRQKFVPVL